MKKISIHLLLFFPICLTSIICSGTGSSETSSSKTGSLQYKYSDVKKRIDSEVTPITPLIAHISVALVDNKYQWIAKVPEGIGNGQKPQANLYWGALYGLKTFLTKKKGWKLITSTSSKDESILERIVLSKEFKINGETVSFFVIADAWDGKAINKAVETFAKHSSGNKFEEITIDGGKTKLNAGSEAHLTGYVGHDILMDYSVAGYNSLTKMPDIEDISSSKNNPAKSSFVLACQSKKYFLAHLKSWNTHPLILTNSNMAPEAYTIDAILNAFAKQLSAKEIHEEAAKAYNKYQKSGIRGARRLFYYSE